MFDLTYYKYILRLVKNTFSPDIDYTIYNNQQAREIKKRAEQDNELNKDVFNYFSFTYEYLIKYIIDFIEYFEIDPAKYYKLNEYLNENKFYVLNE